MKKFRNILLIVLAIVIFGGVTNVKAEGKVKVYVFEAGGCPWCEREMEYLKGLKSYGEKFEIVDKQLYVDHETWAYGRDYALGKAVAEAFKSAGFENASSSGTPFVVISDLYAAAAYSENLEEIINQAYEQGDKDVVGCYANDGENCLKGADPSIKVDWSLNPVETSEDDAKKVETITTIVILLIIAGVVVLFVRNEKSAASIKETKSVTKKEEKVVVKETKKVGVKKEKAPAKKVVKKTTKKK